AFTVLRSDVLADFTVLRSGDLVGFTVLRSGGLAAITAYPTQPIGVAAIGVVDTTTAAATAAPLPRVLQVPQRALLWARQRRQLIPHPLLSTRLRQQHTSCRRSYTDQEAITTYVDQLNVL